MLAPVAEAPPAKVYSATGPESKKKPDLFAVLSFN